MKIAPNVICVTRGLVIDTACNDMLVEAIKFVPAGVGWIAPDGCGWMDRGGVDTWAVVSLGGPFPEAAEGPKNSQYAIFAPRNLRPIRPGESPEESVEAMRRLHDTTVKQGEPA